ncbi:MAG: primosomal protein N' [Cytophagales bacterium]|nr:primosomal protein N' [Cytophagales bacterium]
MSKLELNVSNGDREQVPLFADVLLPVPITRLFTYRVPDELDERIGIGFRVVVQFGKKKIITGVVAKLHEHPPEIYQAKYIIDLLDEEPVMNKKQFDLYDWIANYYMSSAGEVLNVGMPSGLKLNSESKIQLNPEFELQNSNSGFSEKELRIINVLERDQVITYGEAARILQIKSYLKIIKSLLEKGVILIFEEIREKYAPKREVFLRLKKHWLEDRYLKELMSELERRPKQLDVLMAYLNLVPVYNDKKLNTDGARKKDILAHDISPSSLKTLEKNGVFESYRKIVPRFSLPSSDNNYSVNLTEIQEKANSEILAKLETHQTVLLHGITGSGKTEMYIALIRQVLDHGEQALYLLPEIALTTQIVTRLQKVFGDHMGVYHSKYSDSERVEVWKGLISGRFSLIVGVRSAVFLPFDHLGLVIVDEEHEYSYKQFDPAPRYHARDVAQVLARIHSAKVLLGTATPSFESYYLAQEGKYGYVALNERYGKASLPQMIFADLALERKQKTIKGDFTSVLVDKIAGVLSRNEQVIVFQNRRGYAPYIVCEECNWIPKCTNCAVSLTFHLYFNQLRCHYCGHHERLPVTCPACGSTRLRTMGFGTEKLEEDLKLLFPEARIQRMDMDTTRRKYSYQKIINDFEQGDIDILVGTQMVSKGLDFDHVTLVGVFDIDRMLHFPDFRSSERTYQLAVQVSGRSGRNEKPGEVVIQTANLRQPILHYISRQDFPDFYNHEIEDRHKYKYPPFYRLIRITLKHKDKTTINLSAHFLAEKIKGSFNKHLVLGPHEPTISKIRNLYLMELIIKMPRNNVDLSNLKRMLSDAVISMKQQKEYRQTIVMFDVDPY